MTWDEHRRRNAALDAVLAYAAEHPTADLPLTELPGLLAAFGDRRGLVIALQNRWAQQLWLRLSAGVGNESALHSAQMWRECAAANPVLRRLLDRHLPGLGDASMERYEALIPA
jgi:hypothetical protein